MLYKSIIGYLIVAVISIGILIGLNNYMVNDKLTTLSSTVQNIMTREMEINSKEQFEQFIKCLYQGTQGCDKIEKGTFGELKGTEMEGCPCGKGRKDRFNNLEKASFRVKFSFKDKKEIKILKSGFDGFNEVREWHTGILSGINHGLASSTCKDNPQDTITGGGVILKDLMYISGGEKRDKAIYIKNNSRAVISTDAAHNDETALIGYQSIQELISGEGPGKALTYYVCVDIKK